MVNRILKNSKRVILSPQTSVLSAATLIMIMIVAAKILGFIRQRVLFTYFAPHETDLFLAAFEVPDLLFEVLVFGVVSAAFIPVFSRYTTSNVKDRKAAWEMAANSLNIVFVVYLVIASIAFFFARPIYEVLAGDFFKSYLGVGGGFTSEEISLVVSLSRILLFSQLFFVASAFMTGILESFKHFLLPAIAPLFYNLGIIMGILIFADQYGLYGPVFGAFLGAFLHFLIQAPAAFYLGFRPKFSFNLKDEGVKKLIELSAPRVIELSVFQIKRFVWLFLASLFVGGFTYLKSADLLQTLPISVFGISLAKAAFPSLSLHAASGDMSKFKKTFYTTLNQIMFLVVPLSFFMIVLRIPIVRLIFGAEQFDWEATLLTSYTFSAFTAGIFAYAGTLLITRAFYALHDTKTPVLISVLSVFVNAILGFVFVLTLSAQTWGIALSYSIAGIFQFLVLFYLFKRQAKISFVPYIVSMSKIVFSSAIASFVMFVILKVFDRSVWIKKLSFLAVTDSISLNAVNYERFVLDTRYTINLFVLTLFVVIVGGSIYFLIMVLLRSNEVFSFFEFVRRIVRKKGIPPLPPQEPEQVSPLPTDTTG